jgi:hypothetical protein
MRNNIANEVAEATRVTGAHKQKRRNNELIQAIRQLERLMNKRRKLRKELRSVERDIKHERKMLKALAGVNDESELDTPMPTVES